MFILNINCYYSLACAINTGESVVVTGGAYFHTRVTQYYEGTGGGDLPSLQQGRYYHGCSYYANAQGTKVRLS